MALQQRLQGSTLPLKMGKRGAMTARKRRREMRMLSGGEPRGFSAIWHEYTDIHPTA